MFSWLGKTRESIRYSIDLGETAIHSRAADYYRADTTPIVELGDGIFRSASHDLSWRPSGHRDTPLISENNSTPL